MESDGVNQPVHQYAARTPVLAALGVVAVIAAGCTSAMETPEMFVAPDVMPSTSVVETTTTVPGSVTTSVEVALRAGEKQDVYLSTGNPPIRGLADSSATLEGITVHTSGDAMAVAAATDTQPGTISVQVESSGCVADECGVNLIVTVDVTVESYAASAESAVPLVSPNPDRIVETSIASVREVADEVLVLSDATFDPAAVAAELGAAFVGGIPQTHTWQFVTTVDDRPRLEAALTGYPGVAEVLPHYLIATTGSATGSAYPADWNDIEQAQQWHFDLIGAPELWFTQRWAPDVRVGIVDEGIWPNHEDFTVADRYVFNKSAIEGMHFGEKDHGTHVAGLACADDQGVGAVGMAWGCDIYAADMIHPTTDGYSAVMIHDAMVRTVDMGADVVNISIGGPVLEDGDQCSTPDDDVLLFASQMSRHYADVVAYASELRASQGLPDVVWVVSAGNDCVDANYQAPARMGKLFDNVVTVASVDDDGQLSSFSNWGPSVTVAVPGGYYRGAGDETAVWSAGTDCSSGTCVGGYEFMDGTSMAAPIVTGLVALMRQGAPDLPAADLVSCLTAEATPVTERHEHPRRQTQQVVDLSGLGLVNAPAAYRCATAPEGNWIATVLGGIEQTVYDHLGEPEEVWESANGFRKELHYWSQGIYVGLRDDGDGYHVDLIILHSLLEELKWLRYEGDFLGPEDLSWRYEDFVDVYGEPVLSSLEFGSIHDWAGDVYSVRVGFESDGSIISLMYQPSLD